MPAQVTQFCHPLILWIWLFTVCADDGTEAAAKRNSATARTDKLLIVFLTITTFYSRGFLVFVVVAPALVLRDSVGAYRGIYSASTLFRRYSGIAGIGNY